MDFKAKLALLRSQLRSDPNHKNLKKNSEFFHAPHRFSSQKTNSKQMIKDDQKFEIKFIQKYELQSSVNSIYKLIRYRSQEGFNLVKISKSLINNNSTSMRFLSVILLKQQ